MCMTTAAIITTVATVAAPITAAAVASHGQTTAANTNAAAAQSASDVTAASTAAALDFQKQELADQEKRLAPYQNLGDGAASTLGRLYHINTAPAAASTAPAAGPVTPNGVSVPVSNIGPAGYSFPGVGAAGTVPAAGIPGSASPYPTLANLGQAPPQPAPLPPLPGQQSVIVRAPTGETMSVSPAVAAYYKTLPGVSILSGGA